ncbi:hypothetical protein BDF14DRAFT_1709715, partial [Spinellus fusiger]
NLELIEHLWSYLDKLIDNKRAGIKNIDELKITLEEAWGDIHVDLIERLVGSIKDRCQAVIDTKGGPTKH